MLIFLSDTTNTAGSVKGYVAGASSLTYIPSKTDDTRKYFDHIYLPFITNIGIKQKNILYFDTDNEYDPRLLTQALSSDIIFLSGGNTPYFLYLLQKRKLISQLQQFADADKTIIGVSAGAILLTPTIKISLPMSGIQDPDEDIVGYTSEEQMKALDLVDFEAFPHYDKTDSELSNQLRVYAKNADRPVYAIEDNGVLIVDKGKIIESLNTHDF